MKESEFKKHQAEHMRKINRLGQKAFKNKFKTKEELSAYMKELAAKGKEKRLKGLKNYWKNKKKIKK